VKSRKERGRGGLTTTPTSELREGTKTGARQTSMEKRTHRRPQRSTDHGMKRARGREEGREGKREL